MLILTACDGENNIIQFVMGPETQFQLDMMGLIKLDLEELKGHFDSDLPMKMVITSCKSEHETMKMMSQAGGTPPFPPSFFKKIKEVAQQIVDKTTESVVNDDVIEKETPQEYMYDDPRGQYIDELVCPGCKTYGVFLKKDMPPYCADCLKIELGLGNIEVPNDKVVDEPEEVEIVVENEPYSGLRKINQPKKKSE